MSKRQGVLGMAISLVIVGLVLMTTSGCDSAGAGGSSDPILSVSPISVPTFADMNVSATGSVSPMFYREELETGAGGYDYVNGFNNNILIKYANGLLSTVQNRVRSGLSTEQPFRFAATGTQGSATWEIRGTMVKSSSSNPTYIAYYDEFVDFGDGSGFTQHKDDLPLVIRFSMDYRVLYVTGYSNNEQDRLIVQHDYDTSETIFLGEDSSSMAVSEGGDGSIYYDMEHFQKSVTDTLTYRNLVYNDTDSALNEKAIMHMIAGTGIIHTVSDPANTFYLTTAGGELTDSGAQATLDAALATIESATAADDPMTEFNERTTVIPDYTSTEYTAAKAAHQAFYPSH